MTEIHHLNCVKIVSPVNDNVCGHCLLLQEGDRLILIDSGIGLLDSQKPLERIGKELIDAVGYHFDEDRTAFRQIEKLGLDPNNVTDCIISHFDNDHIDGLADFPNAVVHASREEVEQFNSGNPRYLQIPLSHHPVIKTYAKSDLSWFGFEARKVDINSETEIYLIPLFGHTLGHCGVALKKDEKWLLYVADAYYMKVELYDKTHPVNTLAELRAEDNEARKINLDKIRIFIHEHPEIEVFGYHDIEEFKIYQNISESHGTQM